MAFKSFKRLSPRNQSSLISQIHKLINYYSEFFVPRERSYLKKLSQEDGNIYWLENDAKKLIATAIIEPEHTVNIASIPFKPLGYTISTVPGQMENILRHIWDDYQDENLILMCRRSLAISLNYQNLGLIELTPLDLMEIMPDLAHLETEYFNVSREKLARAAERKNFYIYLKVAEKHKERLFAQFPSLREKAV